MTLLNSMVHTKKFSLKRIFVALLIVLSPPVIIVAGMHILPIILIAPLSASHINANVPSSGQFDIFLVRDLEKYAKENYGQGVSVRYELLRDGPTQVGVGYPKYYVWVQVREKEKILGEGAALVAAVNKDGFQVMEFFSREKIESNTQQIYQVFPQSVCEKILEKVK
jgi:hypothetical protein